jgi:hypothetical protein
VKQVEIDTVIQNARKQGIDLTQITIFYGDTSSGHKGLGQFTPDGTPLADDGRPLSPNEITGFYHLASD